MTGQDIQMMKEAIALAEGCKPDKDSIPKVGAVIAVGKVILARGQRGTGKPGDDEHAEHNAFLKVDNRKQLPEATVYTTLEPCTQEVRSKPLECCTEQLLQGRVKKVFIGILDPNQGVRGKGLWELQSKGIEVELFPPDLALSLLAINEKFIRFQQTLGAQIVKPTPEETIVLTQSPNGGLYGKCDIVCKCANNPDTSIRLIMQRGGEWWPAGNRLHRIGDTRDFKAEVYFGSEGEHTIHIVRASEAGEALLNYYLDVVNRNNERMKELKNRCEIHKLSADFLKGLPGSYQGIKMGRLPKGLESQALVQVRAVKKS